MDQSGEGSSIKRPPLLRTNNFTYWKVRMIAFIKLIDERYWWAITDGYKDPIIIEE